MLPYQEQYIKNTEEIISRSDLSGCKEPDFERWLALRKEDEERIVSLKDENIELLNRYLFPVLDDLYSAEKETLDELEAFADKLMDWQTNLDCGVYVVIHDALLSFCRVKKDRDGIIRELYKLGMGLYYLRRTVEGLDLDRTVSFSFQNEMVFTEASSYLRHFEEMEREDTKGYIIRSLANIALCTHGKKERIGITSRTLNILQDEEYRAQAPGLPWDLFVRKTHQQMCANRSELSRGDLTKEELAAVLDSCYEVFKPEEGSEDPSIRWLWPYYDMEYSCGYVDADTTLDRIERLNRSVPYDQYDVSGLYGNVQLACYYGMLIRSKNITDPKRLAFLDEAYRKMLKAMLECPLEHVDDYFYFLVDFVITNFYEAPGVISYKEVTRQLMSRYAGDLYIKAKRASRLMERISIAAMDADPAFFDDIPFLLEIKDPEQKREAAIRFAKDCGLYFDFGLIKMNVSRTLRCRSLFENEFEMYKLHVYSGADDLRARPSTRELADIALGHHSWYDGSGGYPEDYIRIGSPYRQMTDIAAVVSHLLDAKTPDEGIEELFEKEGRQFSPLVTTLFGDELQKDVRDILSDDERDAYEEIFREINS